MTDKQQAAEDYSNDLYKEYVGKGDPIVDIQTIAIKKDCYNNFIAGWEARDAQLSPVSAEYFIDNAITFNAWCEHEGWQYEGDGKWWNPKVETFINNTEIYKLFNPSGEAPQAEKKYPLGGYAPGNYSNKCATCGNSFMGDKLSRQCEPCAIVMTAPAPPAAWPVLTKELFNELIVAGRDMESRDRLGNAYLPPDEYYKQICERYPK